MASAKATLLTLLLIERILSGCVPAATATPASTVANPTATSSPKPIKTRTSVPTETLTPTITLTPEGTQVSCPVMAKNLADMQILSNPVLQEFDAKNNKIGKVYILDVKNGQKIELPTVENADAFPYISPGGKWILYNIEYQDVSKDEYWILDNRGEIVSRIKKDKSWYSILGWLDNQNLIVLGSVPDSKNHTIIVLNPFTSQERVLHMDYPNLMKDKMFSWGGFGIANTIYDPTTTMVIYPITGYDFVLRDIQANKELAQLHSYNPLTSVPQWSPEGKRLF